MAAAPTLSFVIIVSMPVIVFERPERIANVVGDKERVRSSRIRGCRVDNQPVRSDEPLCHIDIDRRILCRRIDDERWIELKLELGAESRGKYEGSSFERSFDSAAFSRHVGWGAEGRDIRRR